MRKRTWFISTDLSAQLGQAGFQPQIHLLLNCFGLQVNAGKSLLRVCSWAQEKEHMHSARKPAGGGHRLRASISSCVPCKEHHAGRPLGWNTCLTNGAPKPCISIILFSIFNEYIVRLILQTFRSG